VQDPGERFRDFNRQYEDKRRGGPWAAIEPRGELLDTEFGRTLRAAYNPWQERVLQVGAEELPRIMGALAVLAPEVGLGHLQYGLTGYQTVSEVCLDRRDDFGDWPKIARTMPEFFGTVADDLLLYLLGMERAMIGWQDEITTLEAPAGSPSAGMYRFLLRHVKRDLKIPLGVTGTMPEHQEDYKRVVNVMLRVSASHLMPRYVELSPIFKGTQIDKAGGWLALRRLFTHRDQAWKDFEALNAAPTAEAFAALCAEQDARAVRNSLPDRIVGGLARHGARRVPENHWPRTDPGPVWPSRSAGIAKPAAA
jgi:hypothetical protein